MANVEVRRGMPGTQLTKEEVRNAARALVRAVQLLRAGNLPQPDAGLRDPRPK